MDIAGPTDRTLAPFFLSFFLSLPSLHTVKTKTNFSFPCHLRIKSSSIFVVAAVRSAPCMAFLYSHWLLLLLQEARPGQSRPLSIH